jgi:hypothetical protein
MEASIEPRRKDCVARVGDVAKLQAARTDGARLRRGGETRQELPALECGHAVMRC